MTRYVCCLTGSGQNDHPSNAFAEDAPYICQCNPTVRQLHPDSQFLVMLPHSMKNFILTGAGCFTETQDLTGDDAITDQHDSAALIEEADRCQQPQGSGFDDDADLHEAGSQAHDSYEVSQQLPGSAVDAAAPNPHNWSQALLLKPTSAASPQHQSASTSEHSHLEKISAARQALVKNRGFHHALQEPSKANDNGYQSMHGHLSFGVGKVLSHFAGVQRAFRSTKASEDPVPAAVRFHVMSSGALLVVHAYKSDLGRMLWQIKALLCIAAVCITGPLPLVIRSDFSLSCMRL